MVFDGIMLAEKKNKIRKKNLYSKRLKIFDYYQKYTCNVFTSWIVTWFVLYFWESNCKLNFTYTLSLIKIIINFLFLDDGTIIGDTLEVSRALQIIQSESARRVLHLNITKSDVFWPSTNPRSFDPQVFLSSIGRPSSGIKLLGGPVSLDLKFCKDMVMSRVEKTIQLMNTVK